MTRKAKGRVAAARRRDAAAYTTIYPEDFGAVGDGTTNDRTALVNALAALDANTQLWIGAGKVYGHNAVIEWGTTGRVDGPGRIHGLVQTSSAFRLTGTDQYLGGVEFSSVNTSRGSTLDHEKLVLDHSTRSHLVGTRVTSSHAAGLFLYAAIDALCDDVVVSGTRADGIHMTNHTTGARLNRPYVHDIVDDGIAVVSYGGNSSICDDIIVTDPVVVEVTGGRGMAIVGGSNIQYLNVDIDATRAAGLYIATEPSPNNTYAVSGVLVTVKRIAQANWSSSVNHGDVHLWAGHTTSISDVLITNAPQLSHGLIEDSIGTIASYHIRGHTGGVGGTTTATVENLRVTPNDGKTLVSQGSGATLTVNDVAYL